MSARDDYPFLAAVAAVRVNDATCHHEYSAALDEIDRLRDVVCDIAIERYLAERQR